MRSRLVIALGLWAVVLSFGLRAAAASMSFGSDLTDERLGFKLLPPAGWAAIPQKVDERWVVAKYLSDDQNVWTEKGGWTWTHKPEMSVIAFVADALKEKEKVKVSDEKGKKKITVQLESPFKDYKDFMAKRYTGGGFYISSEEELKLGDIAVTVLEYKVEKMTQTGPKHLLTWIYHVPDVDIAVQFECLEDAFVKLQPEFTRCLRSFKTIERTGGPLFEASTPGRKMTMLDLDELKPEERKTQRIALEREAQEKAGSNIPDGWTAKKMGRFFVINHTDEKYAKRVVEQAEAVWSWLEANFAFVGTGEYVRAPIIRICKTWEEEKTYYNGGGDWTWNDLEVFTHQDHQGSTSWEMEWVNRRVAQIWFMDRDRELYFAMPQWLQRGLDEVLGRAHTKNGKMDFRTDDWDRDEVREAFRERRVTPPKKLMTMGGEAFFADYLHVREASALVGFFISGAASKNPKTKNVLPDYLKSLKAVQLAIKAEQDAKKDAKVKKPKTEEEEAAYFKKQRTAWKELEKRILEETWQRTFSSWKEFDWKQFDDVYFDSLH